MANYVIPNGELCNYQSSGEMMAELEGNNDFLTENTTPQKRILPIRRIFMLSALLFFIGYSYGINEGFGIPLLLEAGFSESYAPIVFGISSIFSVFVSEYIGSASDRCTSLLGRRRPYIIGLSVIILIAAIGYPYAVTLSRLFKLTGNSKTAYVIAHTAVCIVVFDVFLDTTNGVDRSYLFDSITSQQSVIGNSIFSAMTSAGSSVGGLIASLDWESIFDLSIGGQTKVVFVTVIILLFACITITLNSVKEAHIGKDGEVQQDSTNSRWSRCYICCNYFTFDLYKESANTTEYELQQTEPHEQTNTNVAARTKELSNSMMEHDDEVEEPVDKQLFNCQNFTNLDETTYTQDLILTTVNFVSETELHGSTEELCDEQSSCDLIVASENCHDPVITLEMSEDNAINKNMTSVFKYKAIQLLNMPKALYVQILSGIYFIKSLSAVTVWLWIAHLLEWVAALCFNFFLTSYVASVVYNGSADADPDSESFRNYNKGVRMGFACLSVEFASSFIFSLSFEKITTVVKLRELCIGIHVLTFISSGLLTAFSNVYLVGSLFAIIGWFFSLIQIVPFILIQQYKVCKLLIVYHCVLIYMVNFFTMKLIIIIVL